MLQRNYVTPRNFHSSSSNYLFPIFNNFVQIILSVTCMLSKVQVRLSTVRAGCQLAMTVITDVSQKSGKLTVIADVSHKPK